MTAARTALTTGSATVVSNSSPKGMPNRVDRISRPALPAWTLPPVPDEDEPGDGDRDEDGHRGGDLDRDDQGEQGDGDEGLAEPERRPDQGGEEEHGQDRERRVVRSHCASRTPLSTRKTSSAMMRAPSSFGWYGSAKCSSRSFPQTSTSGM